jgi:hypothetical protein
LFGAFRMPHSVPQIKLFQGVVSQFEKLHPKPVRPLSRTPLNQAMVARALSAAGE